MPAAWLNNAPGGGAETRSRLTREDQAAEYLLMGLRLKEGIDLRRYAALSGQTLDGDVLEELSNLGMALCDGERLIVSNQGFMVLNAVISRLLGA